MANTIVANVNTCICMILAILWIIVILSPMPWILAQMTAFSYRVTLINVYVGAGMAGSLGRFAASMFSAEASEWLGKNLNHSVSIFDWNSHICAWSDDWCRRWSMATYGSLIMMVLGLLTAALLASGGLFAYYYVHTHATHTGRIGIRVCVLMAPCCASLGLLQYMLMTFWADFSNASLGQLGITATGSYGLGCYLACILVLFSWLPLFIHAMFSKVDAFEKDGDNDAFALEAQGYGAGYGAAQSALPAAPQVPVGFAAGPQDMGCMNDNRVPQHPYPSGPLGAPTGPPVAGTIAAW